MFFLTDSADINRIQLCSKLDRQQRTQFSQFLTPAAIALPSFREKKNQGHRAEKTIALDL